MKKRILVFAVAGVLTLTLGTASAFAATQVRRNAAKAGSCATTSAYVDADNDGVCDNYEAGGCGRQNGAGNGTGNGSYVDADNDGVCDNYEAGGCGRQNGAGNGSYVDADNDGVCDNLGTGAGRGNGRHGRGK